MAEATSKSACVENESHEEHLQYSHDKDGNDIAVVGMACSTAGADDVAEFWTMLQKGVSQHRQVPSDRFSMGSTMRKVDGERPWYGNFINNHDTFDHRFFRMTAREAASTDPQQRLMLQIAYQALEHAGYFHSPEEDVGCFMGTSAVDYLSNTACHPPDAYSVTGSQTGFIAGKVSHYFGWTGPSMALDTACSSSGAALHQACRALANGDCSSALVGASFVMTGPFWYQNLDAAGFLSRSGGCKPFDVDADGYCRGEGVAAVYLCKTADAIAQGKPILARITGAAFRQSSNAVPIVVPHIPTLATVFGEAICRSGLDPEQISMVEAHGTGTKRGDLAEWSAFGQTLGSVKRGEKLVIGSAKGHVGHAEHASGLLALIKTVLSINHGTLPPQAGHTTPASFVQDSPEFEILKQSRPWQSPHRAALVSNYGATGACTAFVVTQTRQRIEFQTPAAAPSTDRYPFWLAGDSQESIQRYACRLVSWIETTPQPLCLAQLSFNLAHQSNRTLKFRYVFSAGTVDELKARLQQHISGKTSSSCTNDHPSRPVILCFGGQGVDCIGLSRDVFDSIALLRSHLDRCDRIFRDLGFDGVYPHIFETAPIEDSVILQTSLFAVQYATAQCWIDSGAPIVAAVGHSFGELVALCVCGKVALEDMARIIAQRAACIRDSWGSERGAMMAVQGPLDKIHEAIQLASETVQKKSTTSEPLSIACCNGPTSFTVSGSTCAIEALTKTATELGIRTKRLSISHAFHSALIESMLPELTASLQEVEVHSGRIHLEHAAEHQVEQIDSMSKYVAHHLRSPVFFDQAVARLAQQYPSAIWLEAGSNSGITHLIAQNLTSYPDATSVAVKICKGGSVTDLTNTTLRLWDEGGPVQFWGHHRAQRPEMDHIFLPSYQFARTRHWLDLKNMEPASQSRPWRERLCTMLSPWDEKQLSATFKVETTTAKFQAWFSGHKVASQALVCPATAQLAIAVEAVGSLQGSEVALRPTISNVEYHFPLCEPFLESLRINVTKSNPREESWSWEIFSEGEGQTKRSFSNGQVNFDAANNGVETLSDIGTSMISYEHCKRLIMDENAEDVLQGRGVYSAFLDVLEYGQQYRGLKKLVGGQHRSAGRVVKHLDVEDGLPDPTIADCFAQTAGIWVNAMTDRPPTSLYLAKGIDKWIPVSSDIQDNTPEKEWHTFAVHRKSEGPGSEVFSSDVYVFEPSTGRLVEAMLGIHYATTTKQSFQAMLSRMTRPHNSATAEDERIQVKDTSQTLKPHQDSNELERLRAILVNLCGVDKREIVGNTELAALGIDSLMAIELAKEIEVGFGVSISQHDVADLETFSDLCQSIPGCTDVGRHDSIISIGSGRSKEHEPRSGDATPSTSKITPATSPRPLSDDEYDSASAEQHGRHFEEYVKEYTRDWHAPSPTRPLERPTQVCFLVTGASGNLGAHVVAELISRPSVTKVLCLNRPKSTDEPAARQSLAFGDKRIYLEEQELAKVEVFAGDTTQHQLGLDEAEYARLVKNVTHICHVAWPMSGSRPLPAFTGQFKALRGLIDLATTISIEKKIRVGFQFVSSVTAVGNHHLLGPGAVLESIPATSIALPTGYSESKYVAELMLAETLQKHASVFDATSIRVGVLAGSRRTGYSNPVEHIPSIIRSSQTVGYVPNLMGDVSWTPVDDAARVLTDLALSEESKHPVYHLSNPNRQSWSAIATWAAEELGLAPSRIIPLKEWTQRVKEFTGPSHENPAGPVADFLEQHFERFFAGDFVLDTTFCQLHSASMREMVPIDRDAVVRYMHVWREMNFIK
ncbi:hypothetical protein PRZ48_002268 [Zasmidium cellare]|uniref:Polyketide synthase n=1 Tax=Zasmidium cellare TaxID=395010 RepID=A0ABR0F4K5_ZASCE|nr:hypothetical protein PRZ48_002268 [Zasmidium cellare]